MKPIDDEMLVYIYRMAWTIVNPLWRNGSVVSREDLVQMAVLEAMRARERWRPDGGRPLMPFLATRMRGSILDQMRLATGIRLKHRIYQIPMSCVEGESDREHATSRFEPAYMQDWDLDRRDLFRHISRGLSRRETLMLRLYYCERMTKHDIAEVCGYHESRISQIMGTIRKRLKATMSEEERKCLSSEVAR